MSYLIDALKKAERDRHARREANLRSAAATDAPTRRGRGMHVVVVVVLALVLINVVLLFRLWGPDDQDNASRAMSQSGQSEEQTGTASGADTAKNIIASHGQKQASSQASAQAPQSSTPEPAADDGRWDNRALGSLRLSQSPSDSSVTSAASASQSPDRSSSRDAPARESAGHGTVTYSKAPLSSESSSTTSQPVTASNDKRPSGPDENLPNQAQINGAPQIDINGQLYSSVPGRSFILVDGRRYHEGEKLPEGPAIESITPTGATMRYRGKRYHVSGPGGG